MTNAKELAQFHAQVAHKIRVIDQRQHLLARLLAERDLSLVEPRPVERVCISR